MRSHNIFPDDRAKMDKLFDYINGKENVALLDNEKDLLERCNFADNMLRARNSERAVIEMIKLKFKVSDSTAYNDLHTTKYVFNSLSIADKKYGLKLLLEINMKALDMAMVNQELKTANQLMDTRARLLDRIVEDSDKDMPSGSNVYVLQINNGSERPLVIDLSSTEEIPDERIEYLIDQTNKAYLPKNLVEALRE